MSDLWNSVIQWLHRLGLHPDPDVVRQAGDAVSQGAGAVADTMGRVAAGMDMPGLLALAAALGWASGLRLYAVVFATGLLGATGLVALPGGLHLLQHPMVLFISGGLLFVEFFADKIPVVDSIWDLLQSVLRIPAGAALAAAVFGADNATMALAAALMGGTLADQPGRQDHDTRVDQHLARTVLQCRREPGRGHGLHGRAVAGAGQPLAVPGAARRGRAADVAGDLGAVAFSAPGHAPAARLAGRRG